MRALPRLLQTVLVLVVLAAALGAACGGGSEHPTPDSPRRSPSLPPAAPQATPTPTQKPGNGDTVDEGRPITVVNEDVGGSGAYAFNPSSLSFGVGETVTFTLTAETEFHTFTVEDLEIDESLEAGETRKLTFTFDKAGSFSLICLAHPDMTGTITVQ